MKIGVLTYYNVHNHGAVLQANALRMVLNIIGHECGFLEFERSYSNISAKQANKYVLGLGSIPFYTKYLVEKGLGNILYNAQKRKTLDAFRAQNIPLIGNYKDFAGHLAIIGSDEVFSLEIGINPFLYGNGLKTKHVISYAASFGPTTYENIVQQGQLKMIAQGFEKMDAISVRDKNSADIVKRVVGIQPTLVCDPVILYGYQDEMRSFVPPLHNYILVYSYDKNLNDPGEYGHILDFAKDNNLSVVSVGYYHKWCKSINASPIELLGWIKNANLIMTDTFHGAVMSIICNSPVVVKTRDNQNKLAFLLSEYGLSSRIIKHFDCFAQVADTPVDFTPVNAKVKEKRKYSMQYLQDALLRCQ